MKFIHVASFKDEFFNGIKSVLIELIPEQRKLGHEVYVLNHEKNIKNVISGEIHINSIKDFVNIIEEIRPDFVIFHSLYGVKDVILSWFLYFKGINYIIQPHGGTSIQNAKKNAIKKSIANLIYANRFINKATGIIYLNETEKDQCVFASKRRNYAIIPNGTHLSTYSPKPYTGVIRFMFLSRIDIIHKGLDVLFPAIASFNKLNHNSKVEFHFYGKARVPEYEREFNNYISQADDNVFFHGPVVDDKKIAAFKNADIFILTSRYEGMPMAILEALSYGLPCLLTRYTNMADIIENNQCGWVTDLSIEGIKNTIQVAIEDYFQHKETLIKNSFNAAEKFTWKSVAQNSIIAYKRLID